MTGTLVRIRQVAFDRVAYLSWAQLDPIRRRTWTFRPRRQITSPDQAELLAEARRDLRGRDLCCCPLGLPCHADVLLALVNEE